MRYRSRTTHLIIIAYEPYTFSTWAFSISTVACRYVYLQHSVGVRLGWTTQDMFSYGQFFFLIPCFFP